jgi:Putative papain-like cysteine peptidase (DUF1796)
MLRNFIIKNKHRLVPRRYDKVISIGSNCEVTWNIRDYFSVDRAYPFDWWMTPFNATLELLDNRFSGLFEPKNLHVPVDRKTVVDKRYNLMYHHDFERDAEGLVVLDTIDQQLAGLKKKYEFLSARFVDDLAGKKVLFIRNRCGNDPAYLDGDYGDIQPAQCIEIHKKLTALLPSTRFDIFATNKPGFDTFRYGRSEIFSDSIVDAHDCDGYMVSPKGWADMFIKNNIRLSAE